MGSDQIIILIGFKCVGKTAIGQALAKKLKLSFYDLDEMIVEAHEKKFHEMLNCRQIFKKHGIDYFRELETDVLRQALSHYPSVLSVGGGTPLKLINQIMIASEHLVHVKAPKGLVFERIMITGRPAFFAEGKDAYEAFLQIWDERLPIYSKLADQTVMNTGTIDSAVLAITTSLPEEISQ